MAMKIWVFMCFNPRPHEGDDIWPTAEPPIFTCFNPRPHEGDDDDWSDNTLYIDLFQSTSPRGGRPHAVHVYRHNKWSFNPRPHEGDDPEML